MTTKDTREAQAELLTAALLVIVLALFLLGDLDQRLAMLAGGLVLLGSGVYQTRRGWHVSLMTWIVGATLTLGGLGLRLFLVGVMNINFVALVLLGVGAYLVWQVVRRRER